MYADDLVLISRSSEGLQKGLDALRGVCRISQGGGGNFNFFVILGIHAAKWHVASSEAASRCCGEVRGMPPPPHKKILKNGAISCVLRAIFNHFHDKKSSQKL